MSVTTAAGFVIFRRVASGIQYLLLQTSYGEHHWTPPKGHVDPGEDEFTAAVRETKEEAGLDMSDMTIYKDIKQTMQYNVNGTPKIVTYWLAELKNPDTKVTLSSEHQGMKWLPSKEASTLARYQEMKTLFEFCDQHIPPPNIK